MPPGAEIDAQLVTIKNVCQDKRHQADIAAPECTVEQREHISRRKTSLRDGPDQQLNQTREDHGCQHRVVFSKFGVGDFKLQRSAKCQDKRRPGETYLDPCRFSQ